MNKLTQTKRVQVIGALFEGNSVRATCRMTGVCKKAVLKLLVDLGTACARYQDEYLRNLSCKRNEDPRSLLRGITELNFEDFSETEANPVASYGECSSSMR